MSSRGLLLDPIIIIIIIFIIVDGIAIPSPRVFHSWRRKRRVDYGSQDLWKCASHASAPLGEKASGSSTDETHG
jgi:hypothetical protein